jgi:hypothetical protein
LVDYAVANLAAVMGMILVDYLVDYLDCELVAVMVGKLEYLKAALLA